jgi:hypothetical protein
VAKSGRDRGGRSAPRECVNQHIGATLKFVCATHRIHKRESALSESQECRAKVAVKV